jgi:hypothetical protein
MRSRSIDLPANRPLSSNLQTIPCENLTQAIDHYIKRLGYRLDMIMPADAPRIAVLSKDGGLIKLESEPPTRLLSHRSSIDATGKPCRSGLRQAGY